MIRIINLALQRSRAGEIYNAVDDEPVTQLNFFEWLAKVLDMGLPPLATPDEVISPRRGLKNKQVSNRRLKVELSCQFKYPNFRTGYTAEIQRMMKAGALD